MAVQQYCPARISKDIDLICDFETAQLILQELYPSRDWDIVDKNDDEYRPSFQIEHKIEDFCTIIFGPKISQRPPYRHIDWNTIKKDARPFQISGNSLTNILIPPVHSLAYTKLISFLGRQSPEDKIRIDLKDFVDLTNHKDFAASRFYDLLRKSKSIEELIQTFRRKAASYCEIVESSCLCGISDLFGHVRVAAPHQTTGSTRVGVYVAAPHKNVSKNNKIKDALLSGGLSVKLPFDEVSRRRLDEKGARPAAIRAVCIEAINVSHFIVVDLDTYGLDTAWEIGYAEGLGKRVVGYNEDVFLTTDERYINRRRYEHNFMHGWDTQEVFANIGAVAPSCKGKIVYIVGAFSNPELESVLNEALTGTAAQVIFPKYYIENQNLLPKDYPLAERGETNRLLEEAEIVLVALPRYGMDSAWQIGFATAKGKKIIGVVLDDDGVQLSKQSFWDHWMHAWRSKVRATGVAELRAVLRGFAMEMGADS